MIGALAPGQDDAGFIPSPHYARALPAALSPLNDLLAPLNEHNGAT